MTRECGEEQYFNVEDNLMYNLNNKKIIIIELLLQSPMFHKITKKFM